MKNKPEQGYSHSGYTPTYKLIMTSTGVATFCYLCTGTGIMRSVNTTSALQLKCSDASFIMACVFIVITIPVHQVICMLEADQRSRYRTIAPGTRTNDFSATLLHIVCVCKVRQGPRHKHHRGNEHDEHSFREFHTSKGLSVRNRRTSSKGRANQMRFAPKGLEICSFCRKNSLIPATSLFRLTDVFSSGFPKSEIRIHETGFPQKSRGTTGIRGGMHRFSLGISPSITERGVLSRKVCQICRTSTLPTGVLS